MTSSAFLIPRDSIACSSSTQPGPSVGSSMFTFDGPDMESPPNSDSSSGCNPEELAAAACDNLAASEEASSAPDTEAGTSVPAGSESSEPASTKATTTPPTASTNKSKQKGKSFSRASTSKSEAINLTLQWLSDNYEQIEGMCLPRSVLYTHYLDFCKSSGLTPVSAASFGKVIRQKFPNLTTRRLGTRGQSKYHYYGIGIKETSPYYNTVYSRKGLTRFSATSGNTTRREYGNSLYSPSSKSGTLLPEFPSIKTVQFSSSVVAAKVETFLVMYRTHCQRILDTVVRAYFLEVQDFLMHFWRGMPAHLVSLMASPAIVELVAMCDIITYQAVMEVLIPSNLQPLPESLSQDIREFSRQLPCWLGQAMAELPEGLQGRKLEVSRNFCRMLRRQTSLVHLAQASRGILRNCDVITQLLQDWRGIDFDPIHLKFNYAVENGSCEGNVISSEFSKSVTNKFEQLFVKQAPLETYFEWVDSLMEEQIQDIEDAGEAFKRKSNLLTQWSLYGATIARDMTLRSSQSFGSFHLLFMLLSEYLMCLVETLQHKNIEQQLQTSLAMQQDIQVTTIKGEPLQYLTPLGTPTIPASQHPSDVFNFGGGRGGGGGSAMVPPPPVHLGSGGYLSSPSLYASGSMPDVSHMSGAAASGMDMSTAMQSQQRFCDYPQLQGQRQPEVSMAGSDVQSMSDLYDQSRGSNVFTSIPNIQQMSATVGESSMGSSSAYGFSSSPFDMAPECKTELKDSAITDLSVVPSSSISRPAPGNFHAPAVMDPADCGGEFGSGPRDAMGAWPVDEQMTASSVSLHSMAMSSAGAGARAEDLAFMSVSSHDLAARSYPSLDMAAIASTQSSKQCFEPAALRQPPGLGSVPNISNPSTSASSSFSHPNINRLVHGSGVGAAIGMSSGKSQLSMHTLSQSNLLQ
eukprot:scpid20333/ scgid0837/ Transcription factor RFX4; Regulatory factor X 4; Testis development protein NYD-SP10